MVRPEGMNVRMLTVKITSSKPSEIGRRCSEVGRSQRWSLMEWARYNPDMLRGFFDRMSRDVGFQNHYSNLYDGLRLMFMRLFDEEAPRIQKIEDVLNRAVLNSLEQEKAGLDRIEAEAEIRRQRVQGLDKLTRDWSFLERNKWAEEVPVLPSWRPRGGRKRTRSSSRTRSGVEKMRRSASQGAKSDSAKQKKRRRVRSRLSCDGEVDPSGKEACAKSSSQPDPDLSGGRNEHEDRSNGPDREGEREDVVLVEEDDLEDEQMVVIHGSSGAVVCDSGLGPQRRNVISRCNRPKRGVVLSYDEIIEAPIRRSPAYDDLDSVFEIPKEVEEFEI